MKYTIQKEEYKKISTDKEVDIPEKKMYFWHNGVRIAYMVSPEWTTWNKKHYKKPEEIWKLNILCVDPTLHSIESYSIQVSYLKDIVDDEKHSLYRVINNYLFYPSENTRTRKQFIVDYNKVISYFKEFIKTK